jgi:hypothetical protein
MPAICSSTAAKLWSDGSITGAASLTGLPLWCLIGFLRTLDFLSSNVVGATVLTAMVRVSSHEPAVLDPRGVSPLDMPTS